MSDLNLTDAQFNLLRDIVSYAQANRDDINEAFIADYSEADIEQLQAALSGDEPKKKVATLSLPVTYDPTMTHPDELCDALDALLETALSTRGILEEYGNPAFGNSYTEDI